MIYQLGETAIREMNAESIEARIDELLDAIRLRPDEKFDGAVEVVALLRVMARDAILGEGPDSDAESRWATKWDIHDVGIRVRWLAYMAWGMASSDLKQEGPGD